MVIQDTPCPREAPGSALAEALGRLSRKLSRAMEPQICGHWMPFSNGKTPGVPILSLQWYMPQSRASAEDPFRRTAHSAKRRKERKAMGTTKV